MLDDNKNYLFVVFAILYFYCHLKMSVLLSLIKNKACWKTVYHVIMPAAPSYLMLTAPLGGIIFS